MIFRRAKKRVYALFVRLIENQKIRIANVLLMTGRED
jgi:hypothetical protein